MDPRHVHFLSGERSVHAVDSEPRYRRSRLGGHWSAPGLTVLHSIGSPLAVPNRLSRVVLVMRVQPEPLAVEDPNSHQGIPWLHSWSLSR